MSHSPASTSAWWSDSSTQGLARRTHKAHTSSSMCPPLSSSPSCAQLSTRSCSNKQQHRDSGVVVGRRRRRRRSRRRRRKANEVDAGRDRVACRSRLRCGLLRACAAYAPGSSHAIMVSRPQTRSLQMCPPLYLPLEWMGNKTRTGRAETKVEAESESE
jgi:hypothetical protein